jgi:hypothetical protein
VLIPANEAAKSINLFYNIYTYTKVQAHESGEQAISVIVTCATHTIIQMMEKPECFLTIIEHLFGNA